MKKPHAHPHRPIKHPKAKWVAKNPSLVPLASQNALREAMKIEGISAEQFPDLLWLMAQESEGHVDARNPISSARGLYQLLKMQYGLNPNGENSFGNAVEECQGGIHYIEGRYHSAAVAKKFWIAHKWY
jgi:hypothetical protein